MRLLGDEYVKSEFRNHKSVQNPIHIVGFLNEWQRYAQEVEGESWHGTKLDTEKIDKMSGMYPKGVSGLGIDSRIRSAIGTAL